MRYSRVRECFCEEDVAKRGERYSIQVWSDYFLVLIDLLAPQFLMEPFPGWFTPKYFN